MADPYFKNRWYDKINPEQNDAVYSAITDSEVAKDPKSKPLELWDIDKQPKQRSRNGNRNDSSKTTRSNKD